MSQRETELLVSRRAYLRNQHVDQCKPFSWYLGNVAMSAIVVPTSDMQHLGKLQSLSGHCVCTADSDSSAVTLASCHKHTYERPCVFEMTTRGAIHRDGQCLEASEGGQVSLQACQMDSPRQRWWFADSHLTPVSAPRRCLTATVGRTRDSHNTLSPLSTDGCKTSGGTGQQWHFSNF
jgi:hypothetical protein